MLPTLINNAAGGYKGPVKIELLNGAGLLATVSQGVLTKRTSGYLVNML